jgi:hypothetical protein
MSICIAGFSKPFLVLRFLKMFNEYLAFSTGPCPVTRTCFLWNSVNILRGECAITTWSSVISTFNHSESLSAFSCRKEFPAFVRNTEGTLNLPVAGLTSFVKASGANGRTLLPLTMTPSISKRIPKFGVAELSVLDVVIEAAGIRSG